MYVRSKSSFFYLLLLASIHAQQELVVYDGYLENAFEDRSWTDHSFDNSAPVCADEPYSIAMTCANYGVLALYNQNVLSVASYSTVSFMVHGGNISSVPLAVILYDGDFNVLGDPQKIATVSGAWEAQNIPITDLVLNSETFQAIGIQYLGSDAPGEIYFGNIILGSAPQPDNTSFALKDGAVADWYDNFTGTSLDSSLWPQVQHYVYEGEVEFLPENVVVDDGLTLYAHSSGGSGACGWTGASIDGWEWPGTDQNEFLYGLFLFEGVQFNGTFGISPIILLWDQTNDWAAEIDLLEFWDGKNWDITFHSGGNVTNGDKQTSFQIPQDLSIPFELAFLWTSEGYYVYADRNLVAQYNGGKGPVIYQQKMFIALWCGACLYGATPPAWADGSYLKVASVAHYSLDELAYYPSM